ncbi:MAG TPA: DegQ family serine endoprotease [Kofleriaceae bacterium]|jgi:serine protease Do|nr:DegQ family serine endoprotease [Kofleriaceae bacterium]
MRLARCPILVGSCIAALAVACDQNEQSRDRASPPPAAAPQPAPAQPARPAPSSATVQLPSGRTIADVAAQVTPSVVNVFSERRVQHDNAPFLTDPFFQYFFGAPRTMQRAPQRERSLGSGVIVSPDGIILTNNHVIENAETIRVALKDGRDLEAKLVGTDPASDVAVLRVDQKRLPAIEVADSAKSRIGDLVLAIGNPFGIGQTVTMGIISAVGRANMGITDYEDFIQTDAAINPGNSGGALVDMDGKLVGINTAIASQTGGYQGIGFAIPSNMAMQVETEILHSGKVTRGWLGVAVQDVTPDLAKAMDLTPHHGVLVSDVTHDSPATKAGVQRGDVITAIDGTAIHDAGQLRTVIALAGKNKRVAVAIERRGKPMTIEVTLSEAPAGRQAQAQVADGALSGLVVQPLDRALRSRLRVPDDVDGVVVTGVDRGAGPAAGLLREGDVILEVNRQPVASVDAFRDAAHAAGDRALLLVYRNGVAIYVTLSR